ncbi:Wzz/FepE/Etk N-terminal domain-containing protein [Photobacterium leiognathi]|uniref:Wzz/FepE/Etk N-terminal domain-containing protein n=1 Tax=Photobacterium leiognathi TaxID=553611 RepID=UPI002735AE72|nr:Wzz/FepE/Etk N-terminal domain-containing protein [Photobacterium leiognathi]
MSNIKAANNEDDFIKLVKTLWQSKVKIALCTIFFTVAAIVYAVNAQQWWISKAIVTSGQYQNTNNIRSQVANLVAVVGDYSQFSKMLSSEKLLDDFITQYNSFNNKKAFIENNEIMKQYAVSWGVNEENKAQFISNWAKRISSSQPDKQNQPSVFELSFEATSQKLAHDLLSEYIKDTSNKVRNELIGTLKAKIAYDSKLLNAKKIAMEAQAKLKLNNELIRTGYALDMAKSANVKKPLIEMNSNEMFQIALGTEALTEKKQILNKIKDFNLFQPQLGDIQIKLDIISRIHIDKNVTIQSVRYLKNANYPISRDKPKRGLIIALGFLLGLTLSTAFILLDITRKSKNNDVM